MQMQKEKRKEKNYALEAHQSVDKTCLNDKTRIKNAESSILGQNVCNNL